MIYEPTITLSWPILIPVGYTHLWYMVLHPPLQATHLQLFGDATSTPFMGFPYRPPNVRKLLGQPPSEGPCDVDDDTVAFLQMSYHLNLSQAIHTQKGQLSTHAA